MNLLEPFWGLPLVVGLPPALGMLYWALWRDRSRGRPRCPKCWYDMTAASGLTCPECGHDARTPKRLHKARRHRRWAALAILWLLAAIYAAEVRFRVTGHRESWHAAVIPTTPMILAIPYSGDALWNRVHVRFNHPSPLGFFRWQRFLLAGACSNVVRAGRPGPDNEMIDCLGRLAVDLDSAWRTLLVMSRSGDPNYRSACLGSLRYALRSTRKGDPVALERIIEGLDDPSDRVLGSALWSLWLFRPGQFTRFSDQRLAEVLIKVHEIRQKRTLSSRFHHDVLLLEAARRGGEVFVPILEQMYLDAPVDKHFDYREDLEILTALRRAQGLDDPFFIEVEGDQPLVCAHPDLPMLKIRMVNRDVHGASAGFTNGGDNRGPRRERYRIKARDARGPVGVVRQQRNFGGGASMRNYPPGPVAEAGLDVSKYIEPLPPGEYWITVLYHESEHIAEMDDISHLVTVRSDPIHLIVKPAE